MMAIDERARYELFQRLEEVLGPDPASSLMEHLPPTGWADVARKSDLLGLEQRLELRIEVSEQKLLAAFRGELVTAITAQTRAIVFSILGSVLATASLAFAAARLV